MSCTNCGKLIHQQSQDLEKSFRFVVVKRTTKGYGFKIQGNDNNQEKSFVVQCLNKNTGNINQGLETGDEIISFNGTSLRQLTRAYIDETLKTNRDDIKLIVRGNSPPKYIPDNDCHGYDNRGYVSGEQKSTCGQHGMNGNIRAADRQWEITL
ncbi:protein lin-7 homolog A-like [Lytechinus variegatus]|uniref:protein lin-7 homolog A-like n=1 Tax=Lytechinus variegatus TaxID=7654 RepID=UPI001BB11B9D|nr:protein lin-7 homolog A-like [Lytechinus variegatus]